MLHRISHVLGFNGFKVVPLIRLSWKPALICVGRRRCVRLRTISRNSWLVGTGCISFHVVFILVYGQAQGFFNVLQFVSLLCSKKFYVGELLVWLDDR